ncbi:aminotransferase class I/II-fold pyridoxal phosphate-dependent enzyme [Staphylococcus warneri]|jgi:aspartate/methionine/tyrosine aminotransferase|uniref:aminotransferase class I/II-fold pyridoxal phosphate-dependent enzyme n=1 Tax=Staphylococcus TaxID=1279 RepID=UPI0001A5C6EC|nr:MULTISPECIES: aminotransferase class I/II-fold pyridoxal phosphate-dependent enzyme [Staphylococcus]MBE9430060.1 aminotransferase class I/II-fold pyridoxal phosphate-dependent enzyme [Staphylococcus epidermidis]AXV41959.1 class I and II aminotransferase [Staphylococcus sp. M0911]EEQ78818.1 aminotransferase, class I/II [Staphylococcus warneri L37603]MBO0378021.1 aminotransferase class I/II-fold pyridoxal phosphate-dependent enzyme [Staphylococcus warneri]MCD8805096.1 aminotransferase class I
MNPLAQNLNEQLKQSNPEIFSMLSDLGQNMFYPKGILSQSAEAKSTKYNATIGMATNDNGKMYANALNQMFNELSPDEIFPYAPPQGIEELRDLWQEKMLKDNPDLTKEVMTRPIVTNALTHGLSLVADLFINSGDTILLPEHNWGNYKLVFNTRHNANIDTYPIFDENGHYTTKSLVKSLEAYNKDKVVMILNYPNNPTGYTPNNEEVQTIVNAIKSLAEKGTQVVAVIDDAYYGLFYEDVYTQSLFTALTNIQSKNVLPVRLDGATKEFFAWGFRVGFITFGVEDASTKDVLEAKTKGLIRSNISSGPLPSQSAVKHVLKNNVQFNKEIEQNITTLRERYEVTKTVVYADQYQSHWQAYDFNSGYFMAIKVKDVNPETLRQHLIEKYSIGVIALNETDIRIAFSCVEKDDIPHVFDSIAKAIDDLR